MNDGLTALLRHFADLRDGTHGGMAGRSDKERLFTRAVELLDSPVREVLNEVNGVMLLGTGDIGATGRVAAPDGGVMATWTLSWPEQRAVRVAPITVLAVFGRGFHHPHLSGGTVGEWPLNVFCAADAARPVLSAIAAAELHNIVFLRDFRIVPGTMRAGVR